MFNINTIFKSKVYISGGETICESFDSLTDSEIIERIEEKL